MQDKFAKMIKEKLGDKLLSTPLQDSGQLPSPNMLKNKILIKDKKFIRENQDYLKSDIVKRGEVYMESSLHVRVFLFDLRCTIVILIVTFISPVGTLVNGDIRYQHLPMFPQNN